MNITQELNDWIKDDRPINLQELEKQSGLSSIQNLYPLNTDDENSTEVEKVEPH